MKVKICGITRTCDAIHAIRSGAWAIGFVFDENSDRYVAPSKAKEIASQIPSGVNKVGVFVDDDIERIGAVVKDVGLDTIQFHGNQDPARYTIIGKNIIKAFPLRNESDVVEINADNNTQYMILVDSVTSCGRFGGTGVGIDLNLASKLNPQRPLIYAGGIGDMNIGKLISRCDPRYIDLSSGVEDQVKGVKSKTKITNLFERIKFFEGNSHV